MVLALLFFCFGTFVVFGRYCEDYQDVGNYDPSLFDYVIVGGGGAGSVLANKLSAGGAKTLLLEQGDDVPCSCDQEYPFQLDVSQPYIKAFLPTPQEFPVKRSNPFYEFTGLGGSTRIYGATYTRASKRFLDLEFPTGYKFNDLLPYYKQNEDHFCYYLSPSITNISPADCSAWHGKDGPMQISPPAYGSVGPFATSLLQTAANLPFIGTTTDYNGDPTRRGGLSYSQQFRSRATKTDANSARQSQSTYSAYLPQSVRNRPNLAIETSARVIDLLIQQNAGPNNKRVRGVEYLSNGKTLKRAWARRAVFVAAGVVGSPKLLQLAGIGPLGLLNSLGINVVASNNAVGAGLKAHQGFFQTFKVNQTEPITSYWNAVQGHIASGFSGAQQDIQLELLEGVVTPYINVEYGGVSLEMSTQPGPPWKLLQFVVSAMNTTAEGSVKIQSKNNMADPKVDFGWTEANFQPPPPTGTGKDYGVLASALAQVRALVNSPPFATTYAPVELEIPEYKAMLAATGLYPPSILDAVADNFYLRYSLTHIYHVTSSVSLGDATDLTGAVKGVKGLYVCDNSLLPANPDANPTATMIAVCSKIAQAALLSNSMSNSNSGSGSSGGSNSGPGSFSSNSGSGSQDPWWSD